MQFSRDNCGAGHFYPFFTRAGDFLVGFRSRLFVVLCVGKVATCIVGAVNYVAD